MKRKNEESRDWLDEDLLEWLLDEEARTGVERQSLESRPEVGERLRDLEAFLGDCRRSLDAEEQTSETTETVLVDRILLSTTREDLSWRGDLRLVGGFLRQRLRASLLLRVVAASLLLHVVALPVLAYYTLVVIPERQLTVDVQSGRPELPYEEHEPEPEREVSEPETNALEGHSLAEQLRRARLARTGRVDLDGWSAAPIDADVWFDSLGLVLWCEQLMDELESPDVAPVRARLLDHALDTLRGELTTAWAGTREQAEVGALDRLAASAWLRATVGGWGEPDAELAAECRKLMNGDRFLTGEAWEAAYREANRAETPR